MGLHFTPLGPSTSRTILDMFRRLDGEALARKVPGETSTVPQMIAPLYSFDEADDYVYDAKWHPRILRCLDG